MAKKCTIKDINRHINLFLNRQIGNDKIMVDFSEFRGKHTVDKSKTPFVINDNDKVLKIHNTLGNGTNLQMLCAKLANPKDKPFQHLNGELVSKLMKR